MARRSTTPVSIGTSRYESDLFTDTDTLNAEFKAGTIAETKDLDENTLLDLDEQGRMCAITIEHATERTRISTFTYEQIAA